MDNEERFALADRITELEGKLAEALLDAERAREERNREHVRLNAEWMAKCEELRKDRDHYQLAAEAEAKFADEFREKAEELRKDAERYRWLRDNKHLDAWWSVAGVKARCENIDADIDDAMAKKEGS